MNELLMVNARRYAAQRELELAEGLGSGKDGIVLAAGRKTKPGNGGIKSASGHCHGVCSSLSPREGRAGREMERGGPVSPINSQACATRTSSPRPSPPLLGGEGEQLPEEFEGRWPAVQKVLDAFEEIGIYLLDVTPGNIGFVE